jgi:hypothetical protein
MYQILNNSKLNSEVLDLMVLAFSLQDGIKFMDINFIIQNPVVYTMLGKLMQLDKITKMHKVL